jgi:hypothetical protein
VGTFHLNYHKQPQKPSILLLRASLRNFRIFGRNISQKSAGKKAKNGGIVDCQISTHKLWLWVLINVFNGFQTAAAAAANERK